MSGPSGVSPGQTSAAQGVTVRIVASPRSARSHAPGASTAGTAGTTPAVPGSELLRARLFRGEADPEVYDSRSAPDSGSIYKFLTTEDRATIAGLYELASAEGADLRNVDALAFDLGLYRSGTASYGVDSVGTTFDENGQPVLFEFEPADEATAQRILMSRAIGDSTLPEPFLRRLLDSGYAPGHAVDFAFLEHVVYATSPSGSATDPDAVLAPRPRERLDALSAAGALPDPADVRAGDSRSPLEKAERVERAPAAGLPEPAMAVLAKSLREILETLHANAVRRYGPDSGPTRQIEHLALGFAALRRTDAAGTDGAPRIDRRL